MRVFSAAKTVADCFKFRNKIGTDVAVEALRKYRRLHPKGLEAVWRFAHVDRMTKDLRTYLSPGGEELYLVVDPPQASAVASATQAAAATPASAATTGTAVAAQPVYSTLKVSAGATLVAVTTEPRAYTAEGKSPAKKIVVGAALGAGIGRRRRHRRRGRVFREPGRGRGRHRARVPPGPAHQRGRADAGGVRAVGRDCEVLGRRRVRTTGTHPTAALSSWNSPGRPLAFWTGVAKAVEEDDVRFYCLWPTWRLKDNSAVLATLIVEEGNK